jgi:hypothetical protein
VSRAGNGRRGALRRVVPHRVPGGGHGRPLVGSPERRSGVRRWARDSTERSGRASFIELEPRGRGSRRHFGDVRSAPAATPCPSAPGSVAWHVGSVRRIRMMRCCICSQRSTVYSRGQQRIGIQITSTILVTGIQILEKA